MRRKPVKKAKAVSESPWAEPAKEELTLKRAENGDWALYPPAHNDDGPTLVSGTARKISEKAWDHPDRRDYDLAWQMYQHHLTRAQ
jgi:hypothetical protein